ncbi:MULTISPECIES: SDR family oxidoreductase [Brevundimonas]|uniref:3-oxoacyl-[acyl-carrier-protein] reductase FabG n=1 Tax=Brevundimonas vancanneytii TaxID=1325724 RepID=A0A4P1KCH2_9CAUL|nr:MULTISPECIES: NAD(P)-dependent oxidoreductase [Brevundimonas]QBQ49594.1 NAD(P)-dependent oxidoreductase [Brevundimonas naejangsanensis]VTO17116.1 3-oxoacyl-[acyl-carrier-protein] reductase FabG [Brevundimonas vancanneytii]
MSLKGKTLFITGGSRGIGLAIGLKAARDGANVAIFAKTAEPHPKLPGTVFTAATEIEAAGGRSLAIIGDVRFEDQIAAAMAKTVETFGGIDILVNNASAISLTDTAATDAKRYDLMDQINGRGAFFCTRAAAPFLVAAENPHVLNLSPPLDMQAKWFAPHVAYTIAKFNMSLCTLGHAGEFAERGIAVNSLWPLTAIDTAAVRNVIGTERGAPRKPEIVADAAYAIFKKPSRSCTGNFFIDEEVLREEGVTDFSIYAHDPAAELLADYFVPEEVFARSPTTLNRFY